MGFGWVAFEGFCLLTLVVVVAPLGALPVCQPVAGVRERVGAGAGWASGASVRDLGRPCCRNRSFSGTPSSESGKVLPPVASNWLDRFLEALALGESAVRRFGANLAFVGE